MGDRSLYLVEFIDAMLFDRLVGVLDQELYAPLDNEWEWLPMIWQ